MLRDLKGFYLKLGQILGSKADVLPQVYTDALSQLFDCMPAASNRHIRHTVRSELGAPVDQVTPLSLCVNTAFNPICVEGSAEPQAGGRSCTTGSCDIETNELAYCSGCGILS